MATAHRTMASSPMKRRMSDPNIVYVHAVSDDSKIIHVPTVQEANIYTILMNKARKQKLETLRNVCLMFKVERRDDGKYTQFAVTIMSGVLEAILYVYPTRLDGSESENNMFYATITYDVRDISSFKSHINCLEDVLGKVVDIEVPTTKERAAVEEKSLLVS